MRHRTTASKIIKSQNKIVRTVEFTWLPHPLDTVRSSIETPALRADSILDAAAASEYAPRKLTPRAANSCPVKADLPRLPRPTECSGGRKNLPQASYREPKPLARR